MGPVEKEPPPPAVRWQAVSSLVGPLRSRSLVAAPANEEECGEILRYCERNGLSVCVRGGGYSYGDAILNDRNLILDMSGMDRILDFDEERGLMTVQPGVRLIDVYEAALHKRYILGASPSESTITVAGAIGMNVNGKDGWRNGNFGDQVVSMKLMLASGESVAVDRESDPEFFNAVVGGMGLLGVITEARIRLTKVPSPFVHITRVPVPDVDALLAHMREVEAGSDFAVAWLDTCARGKKLGRAVVHETRFVEHEASEEELKEKIAVSFTRLQKRLKTARRLSPYVGLVVRTMMHIQKVSVKYFNRLYFYYSGLRHKYRSAENDESFLRFNFDASFMIPSAAAVCGPRGYTIQLTFPRTRAAEALRGIIRLCQKSPCLPAKLIMRVHRDDDYLISFAEDGYSLNLELHPKRRHVKRMNRFVDDLVHAVISMGGKVHLAKDHVLKRDQFQGLFPNFGQFLDIKRRVDPGELFQSDLYRRLVCTERHAASLGAGAAGRDQAESLRASAVE